MYEFVLYFLLGQIQAPGSLITVINNDLKSLPPELRIRTRYFAYWKATPLERIRWWSLFNGHLNHLSREPDLSRVSVVGGTSAALVRVSLDDFGWSSELWDKLADPYTTQEVETPWGTYDKQGNFKQTRIVKTRALAGWLTNNQKEIAEIVAMCDSRNFLITADWFLDQTSAADERPINYYDFLGVKDKTSFDEMVGLDINLAKRFQAFSRDAVAISIITRHDRAIDAIGAIGGTYFRTRDHGKEKAGVALANQEDFDAQEIVAALPNRLRAYGLFDAKGTLQTKAPDNVVRQRVDVYRSCIECHDRGLRDINSWFQPLVNGPLNIFPPDPKLARKLRKDYHEVLDRKILEERIRYEERIKEVTGMDWKTWSSKLIREIKHYEEAPIDLELSAIDLGVSVKEWRSALDAGLKANSGNTVLSPLLIGGQVTRSTWERTFTEANLMLKRGIQ